MATARRMKAPLEQPVEKGLEPGALGLVSTTVIVTASADPDCGTTFTWATRAFGPGSGWAGGWAIIVADVLVMASLAQVAGQYVFFLFDADGIGANPASGWVLLVGVMWIVAMTYVAYRGIELTASFQKAYAEPA
jgi:amino acid transporter